MICIYPTQTDIIIHQQVGIFLNCLFWETFGNGNNRSIVFIFPYIRDGGFVIGVSAGSIIFANNLPGNLELLDTKLDVHCEASSYTGSVSFPLIENMKLSNTGAIIVRCIPDNVEIIDD